MAALRVLVCSQITGLCEAVERSAAAAGWCDPCKALCLCCCCCIVQAPLYFSQRKALCPR